MYSPFLFYQLFNKGSRGPLEGNHNFAFIPTCFKLDFFFTFTYVQHPHLAREGSFFFNAQKQEKLEDSTITRLILTDTMWTFFVNKMTTSGHLDNSGCRGAVKSYKTTPLEADLTSLKRKWRPTRRQTRLL